MSYRVRRVRQGLFAIALASMAVVVSCSTGPSEKELSLLEEQRMAMEAAEKQVARKKAENARLERQLANKKAELQSLESKLASTQQNLAGDQ